MKKRLKVLVCGEASFLDSGFSTYQYQLLNRLRNNPNIHVAELACYAGVNDPRDYKCNWRFYPNSVSSQDPRIKLFNSNGQNSFGKWRFDYCLLDFKPDVVIDIRDYWMNGFQEVSPLRDYYKWVLMPTIDSEPQQDSWISTYCNADAIFTYSDWARDVLMKQSNNKINYIDTCSPGFDVNYLQGRDYTLDDIKTKLGLPPKSIILGTVMRNQKRKLFAELIKDFRELLDRLKKEQHTDYNNIYLYLHTSYPDFLCWDIPSLLQEHRVINKVFFTYSCKECGHVQSLMYSGSKTYCKACHKYSSSMPCVNNGISRDSLQDIYDVFTMYIQYSICEGFGMPQVEAASCGIPVITMNYSAMEDVIKKLNAYKVDISYKFRELETFADRVYPDRENLFKHVKDFLSLTQFQKNIKKLNFQHRCYLHYKWKDSLDKWEKYLNGLYESEYRSDYTHLLEPIEHLDRENIRNITTDLDKIRFIQNHLSHFNLSDNILLKFLDQLNSGYLVENGINKDFSLENLLDICDSLISSNNNAREIMLNPSQLQEHDFIQYAISKDTDL